MAEFNVGARRRTAESMRADLRYALHRLRTDILLVPGADEFPDQAQQRRDLAVASMASAIAELDRQIAELDVLCDEAETMAELPKLMVEVFGLADEVVGAMTKEEIDEKLQEFRRREGIVE
jgi:hypothetical protein